MMTATSFVLALTVLAQTSQGAEYDFNYIAGGMIVGGGIGALIGMTKGRALAGFLLGAFLGCIGWIIVLVLPKKYPKY